MWNSAYHLEGNTRSNSRSGFHIQPPHFRSTRDSTSARCLHNTLGKNPSFQISSHWTIVAEAASYSRISAVGQDCQWMDCHLAYSQSEDEDRLNWCKLANYTRSVSTSGLRWLLLLLVVINLEVSWFSPRKCSVSVAESSNLWALSIRLSPLNLVSIRSGNPSL